MSLKGSTQYEVAMFIIIRERFGPIGPFANEADAIQWAKQYLLGANRWWVMTLEQPA